MTLPVYYARVTDMLRPRGLSKEGIRGIRYLDVGIAYFSQTVMV